jgi:hypothetical protein
LLSFPQLFVRFGKGPYFVEISLDFPPDSPMSELPSPPSKFVIELAPLDLMPHSVHLFLEMVSHKLWDGCSFMRNAGKKSPDHLIIGTFVFLLLVIEFHYRRQP